MASLSIHGQNWSCNPQLREHSLWPCSQNPIFVKSYISSNNLNEKLIFSHISSLNEKLYFFLLTFQSVQGPIPVVVVVVGGGGVAFLALRCGPIDHNDDHDADCDSDKSQKLHNKTFPHPVFVRSGANGLRFLKKWIKTSTIVKKTDRFCSLPLLHFLFTWRHLFT